MTFNNSDMACYKYNCMSYDVCKKQDFLQHCDDKQLDQVKKVKLSDNTRDYNIGNSDYSKRKIQPWDIWLEYKLNPWDADIIKRILRRKEGESRKLDYEKIIHVANERIRQIDEGV